MLPRMSTSVPAEEQEGVEQRQGTPLPPGLPSAKQRAAICFWV
jgi:hypothetical protein